MVRKILSNIVIVCSLTSGAFIYPALSDEPGLYSEPQKPRVVRSFWENGNLIDEIIVPGRPPTSFRAPSVIPPQPNRALGTNTLSNVPAFDWCYGCSATSAAMLAGHYDNAGYPDMYTGPTDGGVCPMNNTTWGSGECPLSATRQGYDLRSRRGHVDDYWIAYGSGSPDPWIGSWDEHEYWDCTADYMGTNQSSLANTDGSTTFYYYQDGSPLYDYTGCEPDQRDGCHGLRLFMESRRYSVAANFSQYIYGHNGNTQGFTFNDFKNEIDAGHPVLIHVTNHTMLGYGYDDTGSVVYLHDTWDYNDHSMTWGGVYSGLQHYGVTVLQLYEPDPTPTPASVYRINFQPAGAPTPSDYSRDDGALYFTRGYYGWR